MLLYFIYPCGQATLEENGCFQEERSIIFLKYPGQEFRLIAMCSAFLWLHVQVVTCASVTGGVT